MGPEIPIKNKLSGAGDQETTLSEGSSYREEGRRPL